MNYFLALQFAPRPKPMAANANRLWERH